ncbi:hypothetical protein NX009_09595 [Klebsiella pneumoniae]|nr:hypothetical protein [Klebsiella pneumoniae]
MPAFSIYGHDVQDADDTSIPADVEEKLLRFARAPGRRQYEREKLSVAGRRLNGHRLPPSSTITFLSPGSA